MDGRLSSLLILFYGRSVSFVLRMAIPPFIPFFIQVFHWNSFQVGLLASAYLWSYAFSQIVWGIIVDRWGAKEALVLGWVVSVGSSIVFALGSTIDQLILIRLLFGFGAASVLVASVVIVADVYPQSERGRAIGLISSSSSIGTLMAGITIPWLLATSIRLGVLETWRSVSVLITLPAVVALVGLVWIPGSSHPKPQSSSTTATEARLVSSPKEVIRDLRLYLMSGAMVGYLVGFTISSTWIYLYLHQEYHLSAEIAGAVASLSVFTPGIVSPLLSGWLSDHFQTRSKVAAMGAVLSAAAMALLIFRLPLHFVALILVLYGTFALFHTPIFSMPAETWSPEVSGTALSVVGELGQVGAAITPAVSGYLLMQTTNYEPIWFLATTAYLGAAVALLLIKEVRH